MAGERPQRALRLPDPRWRGRRSSDRSEELGGYESDSRSTRTEAVPLSGVLGHADTYYVYADDSKLMAEYDGDGNCTREYIYFGDSLIAEYRPQTDSTYYYSSDQIRSSRLITDESGARVYSATHGPFGEELATWVNTYDPKLKFSGKEREDYSGQDYFGARYYDSQLRRFMSVDPVMSRGEARGNLQLWNLYAYARNSPLSYSDSDGRNAQLNCAQGANGDTNCTLTATIAIYSRDRGIDANRLQAAGAEFERSIENAWRGTYQGKNGKVTVMTNVLVIVVQSRDEAADQFFDNLIEIRPGGTRWNTANRIYQRGLKALLGWEHGTTEGYVQIGTIGLLGGHEFGHMIGLLDKFGTGGFMDPDAVLRGDVDRPGPEDYVEALTRDPETDYIKGWYQLW